MQARTPSSYQRGNFRSPLTLRLNHRILLQRSAAFIDNNNGEGGSSDSISEVFFSSLDLVAKSRQTNAASSSTNLFLVSGSEEEWRRIDQRVNTYPCQRHFTAIGTCVDGGEEFQREMVLAVESVVGSVHLECQSQRPSREGRYLSVKIGPVWVTSGDQVIAVYAELKRRGEELDQRGAGQIKYLL